MFYNMNFLFIALVCFVNFSQCQIDTFTNIERNRRVLEGQLQFPYTKVFLQGLACSLSKTLKTDHSCSQNGAEWITNLMKNDEEKVKLEQHDLDEKQTGFGEAMVRKDTRTEDTGPSDTCRNDTSTLIASVLSGENWALQMLDAFGKPGSDILRGNLRWLGSFDECLSVTTPPDSVNFRSTYCTATFTQQQANQTMGAFSVSQLITPTLGMCLPETCSNNDISNVIVTVLNNTNISYVPSVSCYQRDHPLDTDAIVAIVICSVFGCLVILGTAYDVILFQRKADDKEAKPSAHDAYGSVSNNVEKAIDEKTPLFSETHIVTVDEGRKTDLKHNLETGKIIDEKSNAHKPGLGSQLLLSFSVYTNGAKILNTKQAAGSLTAVHGIRFLSMTWVLLGHVFTMTISFGANVITYYQDHIRRWTFSIILNGLLSVDSFFTLSGLLVSYLTLKELKKGRGKLNWFMFYFHRFWRLTPVYMMMLMVWVCLYHYFGNGPLWYQDGLQKSTCRHYWWTNLLYINNLVHRDDQCFSWGWYLANDMQFYVLSPLILIPLFYSEVCGIVVLGLFLAATMTTAGLISRLNNLSAGFLYMVEGTPGPDNYNDYYMTPYCRMGPYLVGMLAGYILYKHNGKIRMSKVKALAGWMIATASALAVIYGPYESANGTPMASDVGALYNAVHRSVWGAAVSWVVVACATGNGGFVNTLLSWNGFVPLSRLTYTIYLVHPMVIFMMYQSERTLAYLTDLTMIFQILGVLVVSYGMALVVSLTFEAPMMGLERALLRRERRT